MEKALRRLPGRMAPSQGYMGGGLGEGAVSRLALMLNSEISLVITAMRQNAKWAVVPGKYNVS